MIVVLYEILKRSLEAMLMIQRGAASLFILICVIKFYRWLLVIRRLRHTGGEMFTLVEYKKLETVKQISKRCYVCEQSIHFWQRSRGLCGQSDYVRAHRRCVKRNRNITTISMAFIRLFKKHIARG